MKTAAVALVAFLLTSQSTGSGSDNKPVPPYRAESSAYVVKGKDALTYVTENRSFRFAEVRSDAGESEAGLLLEETYHNERTPGIEGVRGKAAVKAWTLGHSDQRELRWTIQDTGNEGEIRDRFFRITAWGCCDMPVVYSYYSILTGKKLYVSNSDLLEVRGGGDGPQASRYVAFGFGGESELSHPPHLEYGTDKKVAQRFSVVSSRESYDAPQMFVAAGEKPEKSLDLGGSPMNFTIILRYDDGVELRVPVEGDVVRPEKAHFPSGYSLRAEK